jgi:hypothetical protein
VAQVVAMTAAFDALILRWIDATAASDRDPVVEAREFDAELRREYPEDYAEYAYGQAWRLLRDDLRAARRGRRRHEKYATSIETATQRAVDEARDRRDD